MPMYLNQNSNKFVSYKNDNIFVDKSLLIKETNSSLNKESLKFMCVTRPRRFGKSLALSMLNAYYSKGCDSRELFKDLAISKDPSFEEHLNKHNVFYIDMNSHYESLKDKNGFVSALEEDLLSDLEEIYGSESLRFKGLSLNKAFAKIRSACNDRFIFLIDEWDAVYRKAGSNARLCDEYTGFLESLFKSNDVSSMIDLVYMTGILPIRRYITQSTLNMFGEYNMLSPKSLAPFFGFTEGEVKSLCEKYGADFVEIKSWYDGYRLGGMEIYNPKSVVEAIKTGECGDYWTVTSAIEAVTNYMNYDRGVLKQAIARMLTGEETKLDVAEFGNDLTKVDSQDSALCVLIHLGYLAYDPKGKSCYIPNHEIALEFKRAMKKLRWRSVFLPTDKSEELLERTFACDTSFIDETMDENHRDLSTLFSKNKEDVLGVAVYLSYFAAREHYEVRKEETSALGRADLSFFPFESGYLPFIVELKVGKSPDEALAQIKERRYWEAWGNYEGKVLLLGISYDPKTLKHSSKVEWIEVE